MEPAGAESTVRIGRPPVHALRRLQTQTARLWRAVARLSSQHVADQAFFRGALLPGRVARDPPSSHHHDGIAHPDQFRQLVGDQQDAHPPPCQLVDQGVDLGLPADVHTTSRVVQDQHLLVADQPFREDDLLAVAAAQAERDVLTAAHHDPELLYEAPRHLLFAAVTHEAEPAEPWQGGERNILLDTETKDQAIAIAVRRPIGGAA